MCDCWQCNLTEEDTDDYVEWRYEEYKKTTKEPLDFLDWLSQFESPIQK